MRKSASPKRPAAAIVTLVTLGSLAGCGGEAPPPPSVTELLENPVLLDATMVRCLQQHERTNYAPECINAREAAEQLAAVVEQARQAELEAASARKREALRRTQEAIDATKQQAMKLAEERATAEYLGLLPPTQAIAEATAESTPAEIPPEELGFIRLDEKAAPQVTVQEIDPGAIAVQPASPPEPEPEAE